VALVGSNGSGKTTAIRCALGLVRLREGEALVWGKPVSPTRPPSGCAYVPDRPVFYEWASAYDNLLVFTQNRELVNATLGEVGLDAVGPRSVSRFSRGMRQRLAIARALVTEPKLLVLDEPTIALDASGVAWLGQLLRRRSDMGQSTLVATHDRDFLGDLAPSIVEVGDGRTA
jgi:ABC-type multidrug transport system ATPase subunit